MSPTSRPTGAAISTSRARRIARSRPRTSPSPRSSGRAGRFPGAASSSCRSRPSIPETGEMSPATCYAHACLVAEVEVDDETGEVAMVRMDSAYELGRALNPRLVEQQLVGGAWMGVSHALYETPEPYYPDPSHGPRDFVEYLMPGPGDICPHDIAVLERPAADGPFGAKGPGEMCANPVLPAVANAIFNAVGVRDRRTADHAGKGAPRDQGARRRAAAGAALGTDHGGQGQHRRHRQPGGARDGRCARPIISPTRAWRRRPISRSRSASRSCSKARPASARPRRPRRSPRCSRAGSSACNATRASTPRRRFTSGTIRARCWRSGRPATRASTSTANRS